MAYAPQGMTENLCKSIIQIIKCIPFGILVI